MRSFIVLVGVLVAFACGQRTKYSGVNLAVAEFKPTSLPGVYGTDYTYPLTSEVDYWVKKGFNIFRIPFLWERLQPTTGGLLDSGELGRLDTIVTYITKTKGAYAIIDPHNYARYYGKIIGTDIPNSVFTDFWTKLGGYYSSNNKVIFGLMNEPNTMLTEVWVEDANAAISAIRSTGAKNLILVPGNAYTGAWSWSDSTYGTSNSVAMLNITDSLNNFAIEVHQYLDSDSSGTVAGCVSSTIGSTRLQDFTAWAKAHGYKAFLGELGGGTSSTCLSAIDDMLSYVSKNNDVYIGWTYWAGGQWWGDYFTSVYPDNKKDKPQTSVLVKYTANGDDPDLAAGHSISYSISVIAIASILIKLIM